MAGERWSTVTLGEIAYGDNGLVDGPFGSNLPASAYTEHGVPVIRGSNLSLGLARFDSNEFVYVSGETANRLRRSLCKPGDIIFTKKGTIGQTGIIPNRGAFEQFLLSSNQMKLTVNPALADPLFIYYVVSSRENREKIVRDASVTGVPKINVAYLRAFPVDLPPLPEQRAIAHILGTLDDKIELNRRMNETLEEMARAIFKSWFVDFDPVRAKAEGRDPGLPKHIADLFPDRLEDSELDAIPAGWRVGTFGEVAENPRRGVRPAQIQETTPYIGLEHMPRKRIALANWSNAANLESNKFEFKRGEVLFGKLRPYFHKVGIAPVDGICSTDILVIAARQPQWFGFVLEQVSSGAFIDYVDSASTGTKMPRTNWKDMMAFRLVLPPTSLAEALDEHILA